MSMSKVKPKISVVRNEGMDGKEIRYEVEYRCPGCGRILYHGYKSETACCECGTFYDWGDSPAKVIVIRKAEW